MALPVLEAEAGLESPQIRLQRRVTRHLMKTLTLPKEHPLLNFLLSTTRLKKTYLSPLCQTWNHLPRRITNRADLIRPETIWPIPPWGAYIHLHFSMMTEDRAIALVGKEDPTIFFTAAAQRGENLRIAIVQDGTQGLLSWGETIGQQSTFSIRWAEVLAVCRAIQSATVRHRRTHAAIVLYSRPAFNLLRRAYYGQLHGSIASLLASTLRPLGRQVEFSIIYTPENDGLATCVAAYEEAKLITTINTISRHLTDLCPEGIEGQQLQAQLNTSLDAMSKSVARDHTHGQYTWSIDQSLPSHHTKSLYGALSSNEASLLIQCRTNHSYLGSYLFRVGAQETSQCSCGQDLETVKHVLFACPKWQAQRQVALAKVGPQWVDLSYILGGWSPVKDPITRQYAHGPKEKWKADIRVVKNTIQFLYSTGRFVPEP